MKKILAVIIALLLAFSLIACNDEEPETHTKPVVPTEAETPAESPNESAPDESEPEESQPESETEPESESETEPASETKKSGTIELPRDEF